MPRAPVRTWWTPPAVSVCHLHGQRLTSSDRLRAQGYGVVEREVPSYLLEKFPRTYWRSSLVPTGEVPSYLLEKSLVPTGEVPRTYWRSPSYLLETKYGLSRCYQKQCAL